MEITGIGLNIHPDHINGEMERLQEDLEYLQGLGYDYAELSADAVDVIYNGRLHPRRLRDLKALLSQFSLKYTVHAPRVLDLRDAQHLKVQKEIFRSCIRLTAEIGASVFVYHYGKKTEDPALEEGLLCSMREMADFAADYGVHICVENIEIDVVSNVVEFVRGVEKENVGMTFDVGHAYLASRYFGFDFSGAVEMAKPYVRHLHITDNFGNLEETRLISYEQYKLKPYPNLLKLGKGDLHLPPGWGEIPLDEVLQTLNDYKGVFMLEYYFHRYKPYNREILETAKGYVARYSRSQA
jgi:sugar phosphate isomerase/epimerase